MSDILKKNFGKNYSLKYGYFGKSFLKSKIWPEIRIWGSLTSPEGLFGGLGRVGWGKEDKRFQD